MPTAPSNVRVRGRSGKHLLVLSSSQFDPNRTSTAVEPKSRQRPGRYGANDPPRTPSSLETVLKSKTLIRSGWRRERLALLYDIGDCNLSLLVTVLAACMWRVGRHLETIARLQGAGR